jgi:hypothetical protein
MKPITQTVHPKEKKGKQYQADKAWNQIKIELRQAVTTTRKKERQ